MAVYLKPRFDVGAFGGKLVSVSESAFRKGLYTNMYQLTDTTVKKMKPGPQAVKLISERNLFILRESLMISILSRLGYPMVCVSDTSTRTTRSQQDA
jgi:hypothetical protein